MSFAFTTTSGSRYLVDTENERVHRIADRYIPGLPVADIAELAADTGRCHVEVGERARLAFYGMPDVTTAVVTQRHDVDLVDPCHDCGAPLIAVANVTTGHLQWSHFDRNQATVGNGCTYASWNAPRPRSLRFPNGPIPSPRALAEFVMSEQVRRLARLVEAIGATS